MSKPIDITIRPIRREDAQAFNEIRRTYSVMRNTLALMSDRVDKTEAMLASLGENDYMFVAETNNNGEKRCNRFCWVTCKFFSTIET